MEFWLTECRWGQGRSYKIGIDPLWNDEIVEDDILDSEPLAQASDGTDESIVSTPASPLFEFDPIQYTRASRRNSSAWPFHAILTAFTTPTSSKRSSRRTSFTKSTTQNLNSKMLPQLILTRILLHLRILHEHPKSAPCSIGFNRNAFNLALVNRAWNYAVCDELYRIIHIDGPEHFSKWRNAKANTRINSSIVHFDLTLLLPERYKNCASGIRKSPSAKQRHP